MSESGDIYSSFGGGSMPNPCSLELRGRVVEAVESGATRRKALEWFDVSPSLLSVRFRSGWCARRPRRSRGAGGCIHRSLQRPELHRSPRTEITKMESATSASRRRERVALLTDRAHVGAALARASQWIKTPRDLRGRRGQLPRLDPGADIEAFAVIDVGLSPLTVCARFIRESSATRAA
jgi:hypothetical protein